MGDAETLCSGTEGELASAIAADIFVAVSRFFFGFVPKLTLCAFAIAMPSFWRWRIASHTVWAT